MTIGWNLEFGICYSTAQEIIVSMVTNTSLINRIENIKNIVINYLKVERSCIKCLYLIDEPIHAHLYSLLLFPLRFILLNA